MTSKRRVAGAIGAFAVSIASTAYFSWEAGARSFDPRLAYIERRHQVLTYQAADVEAGEVLFVGDSIVERSAMASFCGKSVFNAGISSTGASDIVTHTREMITLTKPATVLIAVGVNDAREGATIPNDEWANQYRHLVATTGGIATVLVQIMPTTKAANGEASRDALDIAAKNRIIAQVARETHSRLVRAPAAIDTTDGVHLSFAGYRSWRAVVGGVCEAQASKV